jgi:hypothetical protein
MNPRTLYAATGDAIARLTLPDDDSAESTTTDLMLDGIGAQCVAVDPHDPRRIFAGTFDRGVFKSDDGGDSWHEANHTLPDRRVLSLTVSPYERVGGQSVVYAGTEPSNLSLGVLKACLDQRPLSLNWCRWAEFSPAEGVLLRCLVPSVYRPCTSCHELSMSGHRFLPGTRVRSAR